MVYNCLFSFSPVSFISFLLSISLYLIIFGLFHLFINRPLFLENQIYANRRQTLLAVFTIAPFLIMSNAVYVYAQQFADSFVGILCCVLIFVCCTIILYLEQTTAIHNQMMQDYASIQHIFAERSSQYELSKETIEIINQKCHDMKHQLTALQHISDNKESTNYIDQVKSSVNIYDSVFHTGNETLDTLLTEKSLVCQNRDIIIKCMANASKLDFMDPIDLYTLLGNALDNAIEYVSTIEAPECRIISVLIREERAMLFISIENFLNDELVFEDGLPVSTKSDDINHGYGTKSIRFVVEKYHGHMTISTNNHLFTLNLLVPV